MSLPKTIPFFCILLVLSVQCKKESSVTNPLLAPETWRKETIDFPLSFANSLKHKGKKYVRFAPEWGEKNSDEYFTYAFLWVLEEDPNLSTTTLESELETFYDGLMGVVSASDSNTAATIPKTKAFFENINHQSYAGKVLTYDAFTTKKEVQLHLIVTKSYCKYTDTYLVLFKISPKTVNHNVWDILHKIKVNPLFCK